jgi:hypothetical protein
MSRRGLIAALVASQRRSERAAAQRHRQYVAQQKQLHTLTQRAQAAHTAESHETSLEMLVTLHRDAASPWDWQRVLVSPPPCRGKEREEDARRSLDSYKPSFFEWLFRRAQSRRAELETAVAKASADDEAAWSDTVEQWKWYQQLAQGVVQGDLRAYQAVIDNLSPFEELESIGASVRTHILGHSCAEAFTTVRNDVVPSIEHKLLASGRLSSKDMPKTKYWVLYQDYVCSAAIRVAREIFHILPLARTYVHVTAVMLNKATGHSGPETVLSVEFDRDRLLGLNFDRIVASDAVASFRHAMNFKKTAGFSPVENLQPLAQLTSLSNEPPMSRRR